MRDPREMGADEVRQFPMFLTVKRNVLVATHRVALLALLFLDQKVLCIDLQWLDGLDGLGSPSVLRRLPTVLTREEFARVLALLSGDHAVLARMPYGTGMRITEGLQLRVTGVRTTMIYSHVVKVSGRGVISPLDRMENGDNVATVFVVIFTAKY